MIVSPDVELREYEIKEWVNFEKRLTRFSPEEQNDIRVAYNGAQRYHRGQMRKSGERFFNHPRRVALISLDELAIEDASAVIEGLLHDTGEDTKMWTSKETIPCYNGGTETIEILDKRRVSLIFNETIAEDLEALTIDDAVFGKEEADEIYRRAFILSSGRAQLVRLEDRLDNLRTLASVPIPNQIAKIRSTYFLIEHCDRAGRWHPEGTGKMLGLIEKAMESAKSNLPEKLRAFAAKPPDNMSSRGRKRFAQEYPVVAI